MKKSHNRSCNIGLEPPKNLESKEHYNWKMRVLNDHEKTTELVKGALNEVKNTKRTARKALKDTHKVLNSWHDYKDSYKTACKNLKNRIVVSEEKERERKLKIAEYIKLHTHYRSPTRCSLVKRQPKFKPVQAPNRFDLSFNRF